MRPKRHFETSRFYFHLFRLTGGEGKMEYTRNPTFPDVFPL